jgi:hypothetical protein
MSIWIDNMHNFFLNDIIQPYKFIFIDEYNSSIWPTTWSILSINTFIHVIEFSCVTFHHPCCQLPQNDHFDSRSWLASILRFIHVVNSIQIKRFFHQHVAILLICFICVTLQFSIWLWPSQLEGILFCHHFNIQS